jgi:probable F420-dependent oxidoreductase
VKVASKRLDGGERVRLGFILPQIGPWAGADALRLVASRAEEVGYDALWVTERTLFPVELQTPYPGGTLPEVYKWTLDPLDSLTFVAAQTKLRLGTSVLNLPWYSPLLLARRLTTLDILSNGRLVVGLGQGWSKDEYDAAGASWSDRGRRFEEAVEALKAVWTTDPVEFRGNFYSIPKSYVSFKPVQKPHPPIYMAAYTPAAMGRVARHADGWHPVGIPLPNVAQVLEKLRSMVDEVGRDGSALELIVRANATITEEPLDGNRWDFSGSADQVGEDIAKAREIGATELVIDVTFDPAVKTVEDIVERLELFARIATEAGLSVGAATVGELAPTDTRV